MRIKDAKGSPLSWTQPIATQRFAEFILFDYLAEGSTAKGTEDYAERVDPDDVKEKNFGAEAYDENKFISVYKKALSALKNKSILTIINDNRFQLRLKKDIESFLKTNEIGKELAEIKLKDLTSQKLASVFRDTKATKESQSRIRQGLTKSELNKLKKYKDASGNNIFNVEEKSHRNKNKKTKIITFTELSNDAYIDNLTLEVDGYMEGYPKAVVLFDAGFVKEPKDLRNILLPNIITSKKIQQETKMTIGGGDDEKLSLESSPLYRKQVIPIATTTGREQKTAADSLEIIFGKQYEDTKKGKKAAKEYSKLKRETDKLRPVFDNYIDNLRKLLLERNPALRDIESYIEDATEEQVDEMFDRLESPEEEKDFRAKEEQIIEETTEKEREKTQGFVKDFLKEIIDEPVEQGILDDLKKTLSEVKIGGGSFEGVASVIATHKDMLSQMRVIGYNNPQNNPLKAKHLLLLPDFDKSRYEIELGKSKNSGDLLKPIFKNYLANKRKFIDKRIKESDKGLPARDAEDTETSEMLRILYNSPSRVLDKQYFGETIGDVTKVMDFRLVIDRFAFTAKDSDGETTTSYTYSLGKFNGQPSTIKYKNVNLRKLQTALSDKKSQPDLESTRTARDFIFDIKEELNILEREV